MGDQYALGLSGRAGREHHLAVGIDVGILSVPFGPIDRGGDLVVTAPVSSGIVAGNDQFRIRIVCDLQDSFLRSVLFKRNQYCIQQMDRIVAGDAILVVDGLYKDFIVFIDAF